MAERWEVTLAEQTLGIILHKDTQTPTIKRLVAGEAADRAARAGARLAPGMRIVKVGDTDIADLQYADAVAAFKNHPGRPLVLTMQNKMTALECEANSKVATERALKQLAEAHIKLDTVRSSDSESGDELDGCSRILEKRNRRLQLDLLNAQVEASDAAEQSALAAAKLDVLAAADGTLKQLRSIQSPFASKSIMSRQHAQQEFETWQKQWQEAADKAKSEFEKLCELEEIKKCLVDALKQERKRMRAMELQGKRRICFARMWEAATTTSVCVVAVTALYSVAQQALASSWQLPAIITA